MNRLTIVEKDRVGLLADISEAMAQKNLNIDSIALETAGTNCILHMTTKHGKEARRVLAERGYKVVDESSLLLRVKDKPGELAEMSRSLADNGININNIYILDAEKGEKILALSTNDNILAKKVLKKYTA
ncbi:ACT domain-containing protein [Candidatus Micrarchaeota archaeon]|nr:ACT domain-containing protein [Candidatus Micrarchaeota archaeon]